MKVEAMARLNIRLQMLAQGTWQTAFVPVDTPAATNDPRPAPTRLLLLLLPSPGGASLPRPGTCSQAFAR
jgi:hypothetical protein